MSPLLLDLTDHLSPSNPLFFCFFLHSPIPPILFLSRFTSTQLPDRPPPPPAHSHYPPLSSLLLPFLAISWPPYPSVVFIFTGVMLLENVPLEEMTGNRRQRCLAGALSVCSLGTGKAPQRVLTPRGCAASDKMTRGGCVGGRERPWGILQQKQWRWPWAF